MISQLTLQLLYLGLRRVHTKCVQNLFFVGLFLSFQNMLASHLCRKHHHHLDQPSHPPHLSFLQFNLQVAKLGCAKVSPARIQLDWGVLEPGFQIHDLNIGQLAWWWRWSPWIANARVNSFQTINYFLLTLTLTLGTWINWYFLAKFTITPQSHSPCSSSRPQFECNSRTCCPPQSTKVVGWPNSHLWLSGRSDSGALRQITFWSLIGDDDQSLVLFF